ncbi:MAG: efflux transporter outer membrane subunit [Phycisphaerales bacterium]|nr:efflux transporter outer membrane subunit [Phycisphaerales bacterium]
MKRGAILVLLVASLSACKVGPNYSPPQLPMPDRFAWSDPDQDAPPLQPADWWTRFNDPTLNRLVQMASSENYDIRKAIAVIEQDRAALGVARSELFPDIVALASYTHERTPSGQVSTSGYQLGGTPYDVWIGALSMTWEIDLFGRVARAIEQASGDLQAAVDDWRYSLVTVRSEVATSYINIRVLQARIDALEQSVAAQEQLLRLISDQSAHGTITKSQLLQAQIDLEQAIAAVPPVQSALATEVASLAVMLGRTPDTMKGMLQHGGIPEPPDSVAVGIPSDLLRRRPDVRSAERSLAAATAAIGEATADLYPQISLTGHFGFGAGEFGQLFQWASRAYSIGPTVNWDFFNADRLRSIVNQNEAITRAALLTYEQTVITAIGEVEAGLVSFTLAAQQRNELEMALLRTHEIWSLAAEAWAAGVSDYQTVLTARQSVLTLEDTLAQTRGLAATSLVDLYRALGGGWSVDMMPRLAGDKEGDAS